MVALAVGRQLPELSQVLGRMRSQVTQQLARRSSLQVLPASKSRARPSIETASEGHRMNHQREVSVRCHEQYRFKSTHARPHCDTRRDK